jgi:hypothetical protein
MTVTLAQRNEARESVGFPGKFEGLTAIELLVWRLSQWEDCYDEDLSDGTRRLGRWVTWETEYGFAEVARHDTVDAAKTLMAVHEEELGEEGEEE